MPTKTKSVLDVHPSVAHGQGIIANLPAKTGRSIDEWIELLGRDDRLRAGPMSSARVRATMTAPVYLLLGIAAVVSACAPADRRSPPAVTADHPPDSVFDGLERRLLESSGTSIDFAITAAAGAFQTNLAGNLSMEPGNRVHLRAEGTFGPDSFALRLVSDGTRMRVSNGAVSSDHDTPAELNAAIVIGLTRMGLLHNLARLTQAATPDHAGGGVRDWVQVSNIVDSGGPMAGHRGVRFDLIVSGQPSGQADLSIEMETGVPRLRMQTVHFPDGEMRVEERYHGTTLNTQVDASLFHLAKPR